MRRAGRGGRAFEAHGPLGEFDFQQSQPVLVGVGEERLDGLRSGLGARGDLDAVRHAAVAFGLGREADAGLAPERLLEVPGREVRVVKGRMAAGVRLGPIAGDRDAHVPDRAGEDRVHAGLGALARGDHDVGERGAPASVGPGPLQVHLRDAVGDAGPPVRLREVAAGGDLARAQVPRRRVLVGHEQRPGLVQPVPEDRVGAEEHVRVHPAGGVEHAAAQRERRAHEHPERAVVGIAQARGGVDDLLDPLGFGPVVQRRGLPGAHRLEHVHRVQVPGPVVHEPLVPQHGQVVGGVVPPQLRLDVVVEDEHVRVQAQDHVAVRLRRTGVRGVRRGPPARERLDDPRRLGPQVRQAQRRLRAVVDHDHFHQRRRVRLRRKEASVTSSLSWWPWAGITTLTVSFGRQSAPGLSRGP
nr:hypothetical protein GCM10025732_14190 [Glycomyces mayteni]